MPAKAKNSSFINAALSPQGIVVLFLILVVLSAGSYFYARRNTYRNNLSQKPTITPTPTPRPVQHGNGSFSVSSNKTGPKMTLLELKPYDPANGATMTLRITATNTVPITSIIATMKTDHKTSTPIIFSVVEGTSTQGIWEGTWAVDDTYLYEYTLVITETSSNGEFTNTLGLR